MEVIREIARNIEWLGVQQLEDGKSIRIGIDHSLLESKEEDRYGEVSLDSFREYVVSYSGGLDIDVWGTPQPPILGYYDFSLGNGLKALVAYVRLNNFKTEGDKFDVNNNFFILKQ